jgi:DNA polymerase-1
MEWHGVKLDTELLGTISREFGEKLSILQDRIWKVAGRPFNIDSPKQLGEVLFDDLGLPVVKRTKTSRSTDAEVLAQLTASTDHPLPGLVLQYRELTKLKSTYVDVLPQLVSPTTGRLHPSYHQAVAATGRLSASEPNIQNIPIRTAEGKRIRQAFVPEGPDRVLLTADYSQVELRILAHYSEDPALTAAFEAGEDIHRWVASRVWGMPYAEVPRPLRERAKAVNFGIIYGQTAFGLARTLGIPRGEAGRFIAAYKEKFEGISRFIERVVEEARASGAVRTILGRQRPIGDIASSNRTRRQQAERFAVNTVIQGSAADLIKAAMVAIHRRIADGRLDDRMLIQVHDELVFEVAENRLEDFSRLVEEAMTAAIPLHVPVKVDMAWGRSWLEGKEG